MIPFPPESSSNISCSRQLDNIVKQMPLSWLPLPITMDTLSDVAQQMYLGGSSHSSVSSLSFDEEWQKSRYLPWRFSYLDYQHFQQLIMKNENTPQQTEESISFEYNKVHDFYLMKKGEIERKFQSLLRNNSNESISKQHDNAHESVIQALMMDIHHLHYFAKLNYCGFLILFMQYDRLHGSSDLLRRMLINKPFWDHSIVSFHFASQLNHLISSPTVIQQEQQQEQQQMTVIPPITELFFNVNKCRKPIHPLSVSSSTSSTSTFHSCATSHHHQREEQKQVELPNHCNKVKKFWVHPDHILEVMLLLSNEKMVLQDAHHDPSYTAINEVGHPHGLKSTSQAGIHHVQGGEQQNSKRVKVTTVYMDTLNFDNYTERVEDLPAIQNDKHTTTRVRWFDDKGEGDEGYCAIEQKAYYKQSHHYEGKGYKGLGKKPQQQQLQEQSNEDDSESNCIQNRFWLKSRHLKPWINGNHSYAATLNKSTCQFRTEGSPTSNTEDKERMGNACLQIEQDIHNKLKVPVLKTTHYRSVYTSMDNTIAVSIDRDIALMRPLDTFEPAKEKMTESNHRQLTTASDQYPYYNLTASNDITRFPYCVVQIEHGKSEQHLHEWIKKLESSPLLEPVHDFSLFLHGVGTLYCDDVHVFPHWLAKMEFLDIRQWTYRGSLLAPPPPPAAAPIEEPKEDPFVASSTVSSTDDANYWSSNTIATIITCYDDDEEEEDDIFTKRPMLSSSSASSCSSLLSPIQQQLPGKLRRSFDSYCSFDHPTSSRSDPTNCKSCMNKMLNNNSSRSSSRMNHKRRYDSKASVDYPTLYTVIRDAFSWSFRRKEGEKEPLLSSSAINDISRYHHHDEETNHAATQSENRNPSSTARASIITLSCIIMSLSISYFFYVFVTKIKIHK